MSPPCLNHQRTNEPSKMTTDTIVAPGHRPGRGGVGIVRVSGPAAEQVAEIVLGKAPPGALCRISAVQGTSKASPLDQGIALLFKAPTASLARMCWSCRAMAAPVILDMLIRRIPENRRHPPCSPWRVQRARLPQRQAGSGPGRSHRRSDRSLQRTGRPQRHALLQGSSPAKSSNWWRA